MTKNSNSSNKHPEHRDPFNDLVKLNAKARLSLFMDYYTRVELIKDDLRSEKIDIEEARVRLSSAEVKFYRQLND